MKNRAIPALFCSLLALSLTSCAFDPEEPLTSIESGSANVSSLQSSSSLEASSSFYEDSSFPEESSSSEEESSEPVYVGEPTPEKLQFALSEDGQSYAVCYTGYASRNTIIVPETYNGLPVTAVMKDGFAYWNDIQTIYLPDTIETIGEGAFERCNHQAFDFPNIPKNLKYIGDRAFFSSGLKNFKIPRSVEHIGSEAFSDCKSLTYIDVDERNPYFYSHDGVLMNKEETELICFPAGRTSVFSFPSETTSIADGAFYGAQIVSATIPNTITEIGKEAFCHCNKLSDIELPDFLTEIKDGTFESTSSLSYIRTPFRLSSIGSRAFYNSGIYQMYLPDTLTSIGDSAFSQCYHLYRVDMSTGITSIGDKAFQYCSYLETINFPTSLKKIGNKAFYRTKLSSVVLNDGLEEVGEAAFEDCRSLEFISIPSSVTSIGGGLFANSLCLETVTVDANNPNYCSLDNVLYDKNKTTLLACPTSKEEITIPETVTSIGYHAFYKTVMQSITIPDEVTEIGESAFEKSESLKTVTFGKHITTIGEAAFMECKALEFTELPYGLVTIERYAFIHCDSLVNLIIPETVTSIGGCVFSDCQALESVELGSGLVSIGAIAFEDCPLLEHMSYVGTREDFRKIEIGDGWVNRTPITLVECTNGNIIIGFEEL